MFTLICNLGKNNILYSVSNVSFIVTKLTCSFVPLDMCEDSPGASATQAEKEEVDSRSIYVGNVRVCYPFLSLFVTFICIT